MIMFCQHQFTSRHPRRGQFDAFFRIIKSFRRDDRGSYTLIVAILLPVIVGVIGLGTESGLWYSTHLSMQGAADSSAISAAVAYSSGVNSTNLPTEADGVASLYNFVPGTNGTTLILNMPPKSGSHVSTSGAIEVIIAQPQKRIFSSIWNTTPVTIYARAVAVAANNGLGCVLSLDPTASGATTTQGSSAINLQGCSLYDNSNSSNGLVVGGSSTLSALSVDVVGSVSNTSNITTTQGVIKNANAISDPYANVNPGSFSGCNQTNYSAKSTVTLNPGVYCGGMQFNAGANVTLNPGVYYLDQGSLTVNGSATLQGSGVTLVFTSSTGSNYATATIAGGATINLTAPTTGATAGIVIFGDRNMPSGTSLKFAGGGSQTFGGAIYVPKASVSFAGGSGTGNGCTQLIADTITFAGNSGFAINCSGYGTKPLGLSAATLVE